jgi:hypothetical protein
MMIAIFEILGMPISPEWPPFWPKCRLDEINVLRETVPISIYFERQATRLTGLV